MDENIKLQIEKIRKDCETIKPQVVIRCITYNHRNYIKDALEGFVNQKTSFPYVAIVHDDASTDGTDKIIQEYAKKYPDIIKPIYETENQYSKHDGSLGNIMNAAVKATGASYIAFCEGDDFWINSLKLQKQYDILQSNNKIALTFHNAKINDIRADKVKPFVKNLRQGKISLWKLIIFPWCTPTASFFFRTSYLSEFKQPKDINGDMFILFSCGVKGEIYYLDEILSVYRFGTIGSMSEIMVTTSLIPTYKKKIALMRFINRITNNRYLFFTTLKSFWCYLKILKCKLLGL